MKRLGELGLLLMKALCVVRFPRGLQYHERRQVVVCGELLELAGVEYEPSYFAKTPPEWAYYYSYPSVARAITPLWHLFLWLAGREGE